MNTFSFESPFQVAPDRKDVFVDEMLTTKMGDGDYLATRPHRPTLAPGKLGVNECFWCSKDIVALFFGVR